MKDEHAPRWYPILTIAYWTVTVLLAFELAAGSVWNLDRIEWVRVQLHHLGYPFYLAYILGAWQIGAAAAMIAPGLPLLKEWAYAGAFFHFSGAVASHLLSGDGFNVWLVPLAFLILVIVSWALRPAGRRVPHEGLAPIRPRDWAVPIAILLLLYVVAYLTLPAAIASMHQRARDLGWIAQSDDTHANPRDRLRRVSRADLL